MSTAYRLRSGKMIHYACYREVTKSIDESEAWGLGSPDVELLRWPRGQACAVCGGKTGKVNKKHPRMKGVLANTMRNTRRSTVPSAAAFTAAFSGMARHDGTNLAPLVAEWRESMRLAAPYGGMKVSTLLREISRALHAHGVESVTGVDAIMVNMGDLYVPTVIYDNAKKHFFITDEDTFREKNERKARRNTARTSVVHGTRELGGRLMEWRATPGIAKASRDFFSPPHTTPH